MSNNCFLKKFKAVANNESLRKFDEASIVILNDSVSDITISSIGLLKIRSTGCTFKVGSSDTPVDSYTYDGPSGSETFTKLHGFSGPGILFVNKSAVLRLKQTRDVDINLDEFVGGILRSIPDHSSSVPLDLSELPSTIVNLGIWYSVNGDFYDIGKNCPEIDVIGTRQLYDDILKLASVQIKNGRESATIITSDIVNWLNVSFNGNLLPYGYYTLAWSKTGNNYVVTVTARGSAEPMYSVTLDANGNIVS